MALLKLELEKLAHQNPSLKPHIKKVYQSLARRRQKKAKDVKDVILDGNIAGMSPQLARVVNRRFREYRLEPYMGTIDFKRNKIQITVSAYFRGEEHNSSELQDLADTIVDDIGRRGFRRIEGEGYHSDISGNALMVFSQRT